MNNNKNDEINSLLEKVKSDLEMQHTFIKEAHKSNKKEAKISDDTISSVEPFIKFDEIKEQNKIAKEELESDFKEKKKKKSNKVKKNSKKKTKKISKLTIACIIMDIFVVLGFFLTYGPIDYFRNLLVTTASKTMDHQYLSYIFYTPSMVEKILSENYFVRINDKVDLDEVTIDTSEKTTYKDKYEKEILTRDEGNDLYKILDIKIGNNVGYLVAIYAPEKVRLISKEVLGTEVGERVITMCKRYGGVVCINGGGFVDYGYGSGIPMGNVIEDGKIIWKGSDRASEIIGFNADGKLMLLNATGQEAIDQGMIHGLEFGPFLIVNGKALKIVGDPWGKAPRVAIGQRKDGVVLFLIADGNNYINGASLQDMIDVLLRYGAYNAANLDGGQSTTLVVNNKLYNNPPPAAKSTNGRYVVTGFGLVP